MPIIEVNHVTKEFQLGQLRSLKQTALDAVARLRGHPPSERAPFKALDDVDFQVEQGEVLGIIGQNGAGKSTLLKLLAGISKPTSGTVTVRGKVAPLIEVGAGLVSDLTGRENIFLNACILGMKRAEIEQRFDEIVGFTELEEFIDTPIKRYSSGMQVRLGFSIATSIDADILIVDEVLAVGDLAFQRKCFDRMEEMIKGQGKTVLLVSHNLRQVERLSSRVILLDQGKILCDDRPSRVCNLFYEKNDEKIKARSIRSGQLSKSPLVRSTKQVDILEIRLLDEAENATEVVSHKSDVTVWIRLRGHSDLVRPIFAIGVHTTDFLYLASHRSSHHLTEGLLASGEYELRCRIQKFPFLPGIYSLRMSVAAGHIPSEIFYAENLLHFRVTSDATPRSVTSGEGFVALEAAWVIQVTQATKLESNARVRNCI